MDWEKLIGVVHAMHLQYRMCVMCDDVMDGADVDVCASASASERGRNRATNEDDHERAYASVMGVYS